MSKRLLLAGFLLLVGAVGRLALIAGPGRVGNDRRYQIGAGRVRLARRPGLDLVFQSAPRHYRTQPDRAALPCETLDSRTR